MKKMLFSLLLFAFSLNADTPFNPLTPFLRKNGDHKFPQVIDCGKFAKAWDVVEEDPWVLGLHAFNIAPELGGFFCFLKQKYSINTVVETGTYKGSTTLFFANNFDDVHTIDILKPFYEAAKSNFSEFPNVTCYLGSSDEVLKKILPSLKNKPIIFYLDAHWESHWPLLEELEAISKTHKDNCIIVIDDFKVPGREDIAYDRWCEKECSYEYIKDQLAKVYTEYDYHFLIPKSIDAKAKFVAIPKQWKK